MNDIITPERLGAPLYRGLSDDDYGDVRAFTITVAGDERHSGDEPVTYVVSDRSLALAYGKALSHHILTREDVDAYVVAGQSREGLPETGYWSDLRPTPERLYATLAETLSALEAAGEIITVPRISGSSGYVAYDDDAQMWRAGESY